MRALTLIANFIVSLLVSGIAAAGNIKVPEKHFYLEIKPDHGKSEWYKVYRRGNEWVCQTEAFPFHKTKENPLARLDWKAIAGKMGSGHCRFEFQIRDMREKPVREAQGCVDKNKAIKQLLNDLQRSCRTE